ncbi:MAG: TlpA family protein disulfide reductase [Anaerolineae bacterium]|jgi:thiol-disulfide isomerase/thioredoxin|nr:TlpA family protein disulfide reductase [Anaerolineae bacterium]MBT3712654.1 TlpA family protein disulfide reductase [Anaerolineae bacterium]MBT4312545.1 TlpA family protein disulfide reductase [Anaerolineae bacterium]MBT4457668.1 TlpA family protein disulfide reductase [Anaerolineae bacterium]MBT4841163.1 TlpA family protein disulfide reductase [Anaerolineae bacterium]
MKKIWKPLILILVVGVLAGIFYFQTQSSTANQVNSTDGLVTGTSIGEIATDFRGTTLEGETISLSDYRGKIVMINDFATWCGPCLLETPHLVELYNAKKDEVEIIALNMQEKESDVAGYQDEFNITYSLVMDPNGELTEGIYRPIGLPTSWFIDPEGVVRYVHSGPLTAPMLEEVIAALNEGREPDVFSVLN